ncbi:MAG: midcut-by-XrtH protein [Hydrogenophilales bacterium]|nr:midcut-by-XrtH protein [Hydrogenophilales bacterium]
MRKPHLPIVAVAVGAILAMAPLHALAQQVTFIPAGGVSVPTLNTYGLILMLLVVAGAAYWLTRKGGTASRLLTLAATVAGGAFLATNPDLIGNAWATAPTPISATQSPVNLNVGYSGETFEINNGGSGPIIITALVNGGSCGTNGAFPYAVFPYLSAGPEVPGCAPSLQVAPGKSCAVYAICSEEV